MPKILLPQVENSRSRLCKLCGTKKNENMAVWTIPRHCEGDVLTLTVRFMVIGLINKTQTCRRGRESSRCLSSAESSYEWMMLGLKSTYQTQRGGWKGINRDGAFLTHTHTHTHTPADLPWWGRLEENVCSSMGVCDVLRLAGTQSRQQRALCSRPDSR